MAGTEKSRLTFPDAGEPLLPGIPNEVTLAHVVPKLGWRDFSTLASVSPAWCDAIGSRQVYDSRVSSSSTETLIVFSYQPSSQPEGSSITLVALYSKTDGACFVLPPVPMADRTFPEKCKCVALGGRIYLWGMDADSSDRDCSFVFDVAGQGQWRRFERREQLREWFTCECAVLNDKIYTFGGLGRNDPVYGSELYDPATYTWARIKPMRSLRYGHQVAAIGDELFVYGGKKFPADCFDASGKLLPGSYIEDDGEDDLERIPDDSLEVYHPVRDEWRRVEHFRRTTREFIDRNPVVFLARGHLHSLSAGFLYVYDAGSNSWKFLQSCSWDLVGQEKSVTIDVVVAVDDVLFALVDCKDGDGGWGPLFVQCEGFGSENKVLQWKTAVTPSAIGSEPQNPGDGFLCTIRL